MPPERPPSSTQFRSRFSSAKSDAYKVRILSAQPQNLSIPLHIFDFYGLRNSPDMVSAASSSRIIAGPFENEILASSPSGTCASEGGDDGPRTRDFCRDSYKYFERHGRARAALQVADLCSIAVRVSRR